MPTMNVAVVDIGTNSTRLLVADVDQASGGIAELERRSVVTRLGDGVDANGSLSAAAVERTLAVVAGYSETMKQMGCEANLAVLTSAVRDASNGEDFSARVRDLGLDAKVLSGDEEARLMFLGAMGSRDKAPGTTVVIDIGGGSTEFVIGRGSEVVFHVSTQAGVVRMSERHIDSDPPTKEELKALADDARQCFSAGLQDAGQSMNESFQEGGSQNGGRQHGGGQHGGGQHGGRQHGGRQHGGRQHGGGQDASEGLGEGSGISVSSGIAVAGTATSAASIDQGLAPYDPAKVDGYLLRLETVKTLLERLSAMNEAERRNVTGLHPDRAPTIVAGMVLLSEAMKAVNLTEVKVSEHDILHGGALSLAGVSLSR